MKFSYSLGANDLVHLEKAQRAATRVPTPLVMIGWMYFIALSLHLDASVFGSMHLSIYINKFTVHYFLILPFLAALVFTFTTKRKLANKAYLHLWGEHALAFDREEVRLTFPNQTLVIGYGTIGQIDINPKGMLIYFDNQRAAFFIPLRAFANQEEVLALAGYIKGKNPALLIDYIH